MRGKIKFIVPFFCVLVILFARNHAGKSTPKLKWETDFQQAKKRAKKEDKKIIMIFQGSDWCSFCIKMDRNIWHKEAFESYAKDNYVMLGVDFPEDESLQTDEVKAKNETLLNLYNQEGYFPTIVVFDQHGQFLGKDGYRRMSVSKYIEHLENIEAW